jgi:hypothetical protein
MNTALARRLAALEAHATTTAEQVRVIFLAAAHHDGTSDIRGATSTDDDGATRHDGELVEDFKARVRLLVEVRQ